LFFSGKCASYQVSKDEPGVMAVAEHAASDGSDYVLVEKKPVWSTAKGSVMGNICWREHLLMSNRERLYQQIANAVLKRAVSSTSMSSSEGKNSSKHSKQVPFRFVRVPADGRCGWRCLLAAADPVAHEVVPRTHSNLQCPIRFIIHIYIKNKVYFSFHIYIYTYIYIYT